MISLDTNVLVRLLLEDNPDQTARARRLVKQVEQSGEPILILAGVLLETVWILVSGYGYDRASIAFFYDELLTSPSYVVEHGEAMRRVVDQYAREGDFADLLFAEVSTELGAERLVSFDKKLQKIYHGYVVEP